MKYVIVLGSLWIFFTLSPRCSSTHSLLPRTELHLEFQAKKFTLTYRPWHIPYLWRIFSTGVLVYKLVYFRFNWQKLCIHSKLTGLVSSFITNGASSTCTHFLYIAYHHKRCIVVLHEQRYFSMMLFLNKGMSTYETNLCHLSLSTT